MDNIDIFIKEKAFHTILHLGKDCIDTKDICEEIFSLGNQLVLITDENVFQVKQSFFSRLRKRGLDFLLLKIPSGETSKTREMKSSLEDEMLKAGYGRDSIVLGVGGGVVTDISGFLASTYCRGIPLVLVPTSLLAMVDASIGGKTGVNTPFGKNLIGSFYHPRRIYTDISFLETLPLKEMREGMAEVIKYGLIWDKELMQLVKDHFESYQTRKDAFLQKLIKRCILIKKEIVERDEKEEGLRSILNFGHTMGHAIENIEEYQISHGEAVALGIVGEAYLSQRLNLLSPSDFETILSLLRLYQFPMNFSKKLQKEKFFFSMRLDKKSKQSIPRFVLLEKLGKVYQDKNTYCHEVDPNILEETIDWFVESFGEKNE